MKKIDLGQIIQIIANLGVIAGIVFLAIELQQNNELLRSSSRQSLLDHDLSLVESGMPYADLWERASKPEPLSFVDQYRFSLQMIAEMRSREHEFFQYKAGLLDEDVWLSYRAILRVTLGDERGRKWWNTVGADQFDPGFRQMVNDYIADSPVGNGRARFGSWE
jgi:hypothetical protein